MQPPWLLRWRALWHPEMYHGWGRTRAYFEGWYVKMVDPTRRYAFAVIPGISMGADGEQHAFIQVLDGVRCRASYYRYPVASFQPATTHFALQLGDNHFSADGVTLNLPELRGTLRFKDPVSWPSTLGAPGVMGWYSFMPFMECYHGVVSMNHSLEGQLQVYDAGRVDFTTGQGYMEKDWGRSFPSWWIWMQSNHFAEAPGTSVMVSIARIPWLGSHFNGFLGGFLHAGTLHRFTTYTGARLEVSRFEHKLNVVLRDKHKRLEIVAHQAPGTGELLSPIQGDMTGKVNESLQAHLDVRFFLQGELVFSGQGQTAGLEVAGAVPEQIG
ncbi:MAG: hypothetical protein H6555_05410 [Lewinellaceae bacterium]|nr:hypothetical protein [Lewinellaceae bacterium]